MDENDTDSLIGINNKLLEQAHHEKVMEMIPLDITLIVFGVIGLVGNILVIAFYTRKDQINPTTRLITALCVIDVTSCLITVPNHVSATFLVYKHTNTSLCAVGVGIAYLLTFSSNGVLILIGLFRYKLVCTPLRAPFSLRQANIFIGISTAVAISLTIPVPIFYRSESNHIVLNNNITFVGTECTTAREPGLTIGVAIMHATHAVVFLTALVLLLVMYGIMVKHIRQRNKLKQRANLRKTTEAAKTLNKTEHLMEEAKALELGQTNDTPTVSTTSTDDEKVLQDKIEKMTTTSPKHSNRDETKHEKSTDIKQSDTSDAEENHNHDRSTQITKLCFAIYLSFIVSVSPFLLLSIYKYFHPSYDTLSIFSKICHRTYLFNNVTNPFIYGFFNFQFRVFVKQMILNRVNCFTKC